MTDMNLDNAPGWRPEVGEVLVGKVLDVSAGWSDQADAYYPIVTIQPESPVRVRIGGTDEDPEFGTSDHGPVSVHCFHTVLKSRMLELKPNVDERIGIKYVEATRKVNKKNTPAVYNVKIDGRSADVWGLMPVDQRAASARRANSEAQGFVPHPETTDQPNVTATDADDDIPF